MTIAPPRFTSADLELMPDDSKRYEIIEGELHVSRRPHWNHQFVASRIFRLLDVWNDTAQLGVANSAPGLLFADDDVVLDVVWIGRERLATMLRDGKLYGAPELVVEILSPGSANEQRDRELKRCSLAELGEASPNIGSWTGAPAPSSCFAVSRRPWCSSRRSTTLMI